MLNKSKTQLVSLSKTQENDSLEQFERFFNVISEAYRPVEFRSNVKLWGSALLALILWALLVAIAWSHFKELRTLAQKLSMLSENANKNNTDGNIENQIRLIEKSAAMVDSTANRLYTFLSPIVVSITGYFFVTSSSLSPVNLPIKPPLANPTAPSIETPNNSSDDPQSYFIIKHNVIC